MKVVEFTLLAAAALGVASGGAVGRSRSLSRRPSGGWDEEDEGAMTLSPGGGRWG